MKIIFKHSIEGFIRCDNCKKQVDVHKVVDYEDFERALKEDNKPSWVVGYQDKDTNKRMDFCCQTCYELYLKRQSKLDNYEKNNHEQEK